MYEKEKEEEDYRMVTVVARNEGREILFLINSGLLSYTTSVCTS